ncbi:phosphoenolpyruvate--protein phosphotransferase [Thalassotalea maritima]|uniref:phosphoenolpyruvate--protein phosphotransferase n=1 Tax=Thalassotalea maritima TaxID=3242416 RepID=UPI003528C6CB
MLTTLRRIVLAFNQQPELDVALSNMVSDVKTALATDCCSVYLADDSKQHFLLMASDGLAQGSLGRTAIGFSEGLVGLVGQREEPINIDNAQQHPRFKYAPEVEEDDLFAFLGTPIIHQRRVVGVLTVQQKQARQFDENEEAFLVTLSAQLAGAIANIDSKGSRTRLASLPSKPFLQGIPSSPGVAIGNIFVSYPKAQLSSVSLTKTEQPKEQAAALKQALQRTRSDLTKMAEQMQGVIPQDTLEIFEMYRHMLESATIGNEIYDKIAEGWDAQSALKLIIDQYVVQFEGVEDAYIRERATDIKDLGNRVLLHLQENEAQHIAVPDDMILVAEEVTAALLAEFQQSQIRAVVSLRGSTNSHAVILARALGIPAVVGLGQMSLASFRNQQAIVDGYSGEVYLSPKASILTKYRRLQREEQELNQIIAKVINLPAITRDGRSIELLLNAGLSSQFDESMKNGASGIGLYRTEIPFMERNCFPSEQEQYQWYQVVLASFPRQPVVMRTLDIGGDKELTYFPVEESNPFLGWRGIRITLDHPEIFLVQIRAMLKANADSGNLEIMLPMISNVSEVDEAITLIKQAHAEVSSELQQQLAKPKLGVMIEVPSVIFQLDELAQRVDFFSVGSNDLTQYLLAVDRNNARVSGLYDVYHPSVLRALNFIAERAQKNLIELSLCGELAGEPAGALLLLAMGYDKLSMTSKSIPKVKWVVRNVEFKHSQKILAHCLQCATSEQVHAYLNRELEQLGFGSFVRAGK